MSSRRKQARKRKAIVKTTNKMGAQKTATLMQRIIKGSVQRGN